MAACRTVSRPVRPDLAATPRPFTLALGAAVVLTIALALVRLARPLRARARG